MKKETSTTEWNTIKDKINVKSKYKIPEDADMADWNFVFDKDTMELSIDITYSREV
jgi:hypothetical protein